MEDLRAGKEIVEYAMQLAKHNREMAFLTGKVGNTISSEDVFSITRTMANGVSKYSEIIFKATKGAPERNIGIATMGETLENAYNFYFDKTVELCCQYIFGNLGTIDFKYEDLKNKAGKKNIPPVVALRLVPVVNKLNLMLPELCKYISSNKYIRKKHLPLADMVESVLMAAVFVATEFCREMDLDKETELESL